MAPHAGFGQQGMTQMMQAFANGLPGAQKTAPQIPIDNRRSLALSCQLSGWRRRQLRLVHRAGMGYGYNPLAAAWNPGLASYMGQQFPGYLQLAQQQVSVP